MVDKAQENTGAICKRFVNYAFYEPWDSENRVCQDNVTALDLGRGSGLRGGWMLDS